MWGFLTFNECVCEGSWRVCTRRVMVCRGDLGQRVGLSLRPLLEKRTWTGEKAWWRRTYSVTSHHCREMFGVHSLLHISWQNSSWNLFTQVLSLEGEGAQVNRHVYTHIYINKRGSGLKTDVLNQRRSTHVLISFVSSYIFLLIASCISTMHLFWVLPCLVKKKTKKTRRNTRLVLQR